MDRLTLQAREIPKGYIKRQSGRTTSAWLRLSCSLTLLSSSFQSPNSECRLLKFSRLKTKRSTPLQVVRQSRNLMPLSASVPLVPCYYKVRFYQ